MCIDNKVMESEKDLIFLYTIWPDKEMVKYMYSSTFTKTTADYFITLAVDKPFSFRLQFWVFALQGFNRHQSGGLYSQNDKQIPQR